MGCRTAPAGEFAPPKFPFPRFTPVSPRTERGSVEVPCIWPIFETLAHRISSNGTSLRPRNCRTGDPVPGGAGVSVWRRTNAAGRANANQRRQTVPSWAPRRTRRARTLRSSQRTRRGSTFASSTPTAAARSTGSSCPNTPMKFSTAMWPTWAGDVLRLPRARPLRAGGRPSIQSQQAPARPLCARPCGQADVGPRRFRLHARRRRRRPDP